METVNNEGGASRGIDVAGLENALASMWRETAQAPEGSEEQAGVTRVCVLNLIVYAPGGGARERLEELLGEVVSLTPCRALILLVDRASASARLDAYVSMRCQSGARGRKQVCGEQVTIEAAGAAVGTLASAVEPLLVPDIPTFLWWQDIPHYEDKLFARLVALADRVVIDSAAFDHPHEDLARVARLVAAHGRVVLSDLNWARLTTWRDLIAGFWDAPASRPHLDALDSVEIEFAPSASSAGSVSAQALLAAGWLASRLGWRVVGEEEAEEEAAAGGGEGGAGRAWRVEAGGRSIRVTLRPDAAGGAGHEGGTLSRVTLGNAGARARFCALKNPDWTKLETSAKIGGALTAGRVLAYEARTEGQRLAKELTLLARDRVYEEAVAAAARFVETAAGRASES